MSDVVISARGLGKRYLIGHETVDRSQTFRERIMAGAGGLVRNLAKTAKGEQLIQGEVEEFWALNDIDFDIRRGDTVGIIGRNGAGKSTLLKILSRITEPTTGRVDIRGRVASLLEVGTGFHPELTGRENIFLNGAILGMSRAEIRRKLDEIIDFAGVEKFLDTPVKRYSSGMRVRLAFSVAAHLEPEILIVDEVLAVGDVEFQRKCLGKMEDVAGSGRTVLFVSHNLAAVEALCAKCINLKDGYLKQAGPTPDILRRYREESQFSVEEQDGARDQRLGQMLTACRIRINGNESKVARTGDAVEIDVICEGSTDHLHCAIGLRNEDSVRVLHFESQNVSQRDVRSAANIFSLTIDSLPLSPGTYHVSVALRHGEQTVERALNASTIEVSESVFEGRQVTRGRFPTVAYASHCWSVPSELA